MAETTNLARIAAAFSPALNTSSCYRFTNIVAAAAPKPFLRFSPTPAFPHLLRRRTRLPVQVRSMSSQSSSSEASVKKTIAHNPVVVYSKSWCPYSMEVKALFERIGVKPFVIELDHLGAEGAELQSTLANLTGQTTVPNVFIGGKHIGGCTDTLELHQKGELRTLLSQLNM